IRGAFASSSSGKVLGMGSRARAREPKVYSAGASKRESGSRRGRAPRPAAAPPAQLGGREAVTHTVERRVESGRPAEVPSDVELSASALAGSERAFHDLVVRYER